MSKTNRDPLRLPVSLPALAFAATGSLLLGFRLGIPWLLPILNVLPAYGIMVWCLKRGNRGMAVGLMIWWAVWMGGVATFLAVADPWQNASSVVINGQSYLDEMQAWVATGVGCESSPSCFVPQHLLHGGIFAVLALLTASAGALAMGAVLMNYMSFYVGSLAGGSETAFMTALAGWHPWSVVRIISFVVLGVVLAEPMLVKVAKAPVIPGRLKWILIGLGGLALDLTMKTIMAPSWSEILRQLTGG
jgi:hypothetical protein